MSKRDIRARPSRINIPHHQQHETQAPHGRSRDAGTPVSASFRAPSRTSSLKPTIPTTSPRRGMSLGSSLRTPVRATRSTGRSQFFNQEIPVVVSPTQSIPVDAGSNSGMNADRDSDDDDEDEDLALVEPFAMPAPTPAEIAADRLRLRTTYDPQNPPPDDPIIAEGTALGVIADLEGRKWLEQLLRLNRWATSGHISYVSGQYGPPESCTVDQLRPQERRVLDLDFQRAPIVSRRPVKGGKGRKDTREYWAKRDKILSAGVRKRRVQMTTTTAATRPQRFGAFFGAPTFGGEALRTPPSRSTPLAQAFGDWIGENYQASETYYFDSNTCSRRDSKRCDCIDNQNFQPTPIWALSSNAPEEHEDQHKCTKRP
ncbi:hypothetical protein BD289DRAFT_102369 [Coniella lustricola]|uniref:Uncharacterized protein n=1 Tax=Coniella lustricola TaxID=2025994 RepID=A0A2T3AGY6_9PEZI|nr:hypothetical protein BD289DRAFT_102369 [Coniella lustricola]